MAPCGRSAPVPAFEPSHNRIDGWQTTRQITKLQEIEQSIRSKNSQPSPRPVSAPRRAPAPGDDFAAQPIRHRRRAKLGRRRFRVNGYAASSREQQRFRRGSLHNHHAGQITAEMFLEE
jgi:hypothetical protein